MTGLGSRNGRQGAGHGGARGERQHAAIWLASIVIAQLLGLLPAPAQPVPAERPRTILAAPVAPTGRERIMIPPSHDDCIYNPAACREVPELRLRLGIDAIMTRRFEARRSEPPLAPAPASAPAPAVCPGPPQAVTDAVVSYTRTPVWTVCKAVSDQLLALRWSTRKLADGTEELVYVHAIDKIAPTMTMRERYRDLLKQYRAACLNKTQLLDAAGPETSAQIRKDVGLFTAEGASYPWCTGVRVGKYIVTARHCFASDRNVRSPVVVPRRMRFASFEEPDKPISFMVSREFHPEGAVYDPENFAEDWLILEQDGAPSSATAAIELAVPELWENLIALGLDANGILLRQIDRSLGQPNASVRAEELFKPVIDASPFCRAGLLQRSRFFHSCYTEFGMSGMPLLAIRGGNRPVLVGIQVGFSINHGDACADRERVRRTIPNYAVVLPEKTVESINASARARGR